MAGSLKMWPLLLCFIQFVTAQNHADDSAITTTPLPVLPDHERLVCTAPEDIDSTMNTGNVRILPRSTWLARPPTDALNNLTLPLTRVVVSHTATEGCCFPSKCAMKVKDIQTFHMDGFEWWDIGYNYLIGEDGNVYKGRGWDKQGAHTKGFNSGSLGVAFIGTFTTSLPHPDAIEAFHNLMDLGVQEGKLDPDYTLFSHCQITVHQSSEVALAREVLSWPHSNPQQPLKCIQESHDEVPVPAFHWETEGH